MPVMSRLGPSTDFGFPAECWSTVVQEPPRPRIHSVSELRMLDPQTSTYLWLWSYWWSSRSTLPQIPGWLQQTLLTSSEYWFTPDGSHKLISSSNYAPSLLFDPRISASCSAPKFDSRRTGGCKCIPGWTRNHLDFNRLCPISIRPLLLCFCASVL